MTEDFKSFGDKVGAWSIENHTHAFAAWAAGSAGRLPMRGPNGSSSKRWLESTGFHEQFFIPEISSPEEMDELHRRWRREFIGAAQSDGHGLSHGRAAKFINVYNKARFLRPEVADRTPYCFLHPPIDGLLIARIRAVLSGSYLSDFKRLTTRPWSQLDSPQYEELIITLRSWMTGLPFWKLEAFWPGAR